VQGFLDGFTESNCSIYGWARDPLTTSPIQIRVYTGGDLNSGVLVTTFMADQLRNLPFPDQNHGFNYAFTDAEVISRGFADGQPHTIYSTALLRAAPLWA
jgi:hypothetical protein